MPNVMAQNGSTFLATGSITLGLLASAATAQATITDANITTTSKVFVSTGEGSTHAGATARSTVIAQVISLAAGSAVVQYTNLGAGATLATDYILNYLVLG